MNVAKNGSDRRKTKKSESMVTDDQESQAGDKKKKKKRKYKAKKLVLNVSQTKYHIVRYVAKTMFKMRLSAAQYHAEYDDPKDEWDILWTDGII